MTLQVPSEKRTDARNLYLSTYESVAKLNLPLQRKAILF